MAKITYEEAKSNLEETSREIQIRQDAIRQANSEIEQLVAQYNYLQGVVDILAPEEEETVEE